MEKGCWKDCSFRDKPLNHVTWWRLQPEKVVKHTFKCISHATRPFCKLLISV